MTVCGTGSWGGPLPGDPSDDVVLSATTSYGGIDVSWTYPSIHPEAVAYFRVFRSTTSDFLTAVEQAKVSGSRYLDKTPTDATVNVTYYYWLQIMSVHGSPGVYVGPASAIAYVPVAQTIEMLTGKIDASALAAALSSKIGGITTLGQDLLAEIAARQADGEAMTGILTQTQSNLTAVSALVQSESTQRTNDNIALANAITTAQATAAGNIALAQTNLQTNINLVDGKVTAIGALYTAKVTVNGLVGGFGIYNDGTTVDAGFDVDTFWVGKTNANKRKPFIIVNGVTYIDDAAIRNLTFDKLTATDGSLVVAEGKLSANFIDTRGMSIRNAAGDVIFSAGAGLDATYINKASITSLSALSANLGAVTAGDITGTAIHSGAYTAAWAWPAAGAGGGYLLNATGLLMGNFNDGKYFYATAAGDIGAPGFSVANGILTISQVNVIDTLNVKGNAITVPQGMSYGINPAAVFSQIANMVMNTGGFPVYVTLNGVFAGPPNNGSPRTIYLYVAGVNVANVTVPTYGNYSVSTYVGVPAGAFNITAYTSAGGDGITFIGNIFALGTKR